MRLEDVVAGYRVAGVGQRRVVLRGVTLALAPGRVTAILGANGAGKSTLLRVLLGFLAPWAGCVTLDGRPPREGRRRHGIGYLPEAVELPAGWRVRSLLREGERLARRGDEARAPKRPIDGGLDAWLPRRTCALSRGIARRVALAFALAGDPPLVIMDEPFAGLDPPSREALASTIRSLRERAVTVVLASHDLGEVTRLADDVVVLARGLALGAGAAGDVPRHALLAMMGGADTP